MIGSNTTENIIIHRRITTKKRKMITSKQQEQQRRQLKKHINENNLEKLQEQHRINNKEMFSNHQQKA